ncbi:MAG: acetyl-CoA C-acetyltransferase [Gammaproteobacteria bacterium]|nr:acetyl-CoA C-acetyltransferase [Gammaproteobacteria bacterium]MDE2349207.1 acetyl-CoA C-acetyltransferase [Gammaproteobacteria bacterium]
MLVGTGARRVAIAGGVRIPFARGHGAYAEVGDQEMLTAALAAVVDRFGLRGERLGEVAAGAVMKHPSQWNLVRESVLGSGLSPQTPGLDLQRACGTGLEAAIQIGNKIALGQIDAGIAGGADTVSDPPVAFPRDFQRLLLKSYRARTTAARASAWLGLRPRHFKPALPGITEPRTGLSMGESTELMVKTWGISREQQDQLALESHRKAAEAYANGFYRGLVQPYLGLDRDNNVRADTSMEKLAKLAPVFDRSGAGTLTAGNSTPMTDGASAVLLCSEAWARQRDLPVLAYLAYGKTAAVDYAGGREGLLMAPAYAVPAMLRDSGMRLQDFDYYEIHEAFAGQVLCTLQAWNDPAFCREKLARDEVLGTIDRSRLNVRGGSLAIGHPFAATGGRLVATLAKILDEQRGRRGLISVCTAGGMGVTAILER